MTRSKREPLRPGAHRQLTDRTHTLRRAAPRAAGRAHHDGKALGMPVRQLSFRQYSASGVRAEPTRPVYAIPAAYSSSAHWPL